MQPMRRPAVAGPSEHRRAPAQPARAARPTATTAAWEDLWLFVAGTGSVIFMAELVWVAVR